MNNYFPDLGEEGVKGQKGGKNPAFHLIGNRLYSGQSHVELLIELLLVINSPKRFEEEGTLFTSVLPKMDVLRNWTDAQLFYQPKQRLNQKLFSFLSNSPLASRPQVQRKQYQYLHKQFKQSISTQQDTHKEQAASSIAALFQGYHRVGSGRNWSAQSFLPIAPALLAGETIWNEKKSLQTNPEAWEEVLKSISTHFSFNRHMFLARGGEFFYLQICNGLKRPIEEIKKWADEVGLDFSKEELDPEVIHKKISNGFQALMEICPKTFSDIANFINTDLDAGKTSDCSDKNREGEERFASTGWVNAESWKEGYLLAVELSRLLMSNCNLIEKIELLEMLCGTHALRSLSLSSSRVLEETYTLPWPHFHMVVSKPAETNIGVKRLAEESVKKIELNIYKSLRIDCFSELRADKKPKQLDDIDSDYGPKLYRKHGKAMGIIVPKRGKGARFVLTDELLRLLVLTCVEPGTKITYDSFRQRVTRQFGIVFNKIDLAEASKWINGGLVITTETENDLWVQDMLEAAGFLIHLSDACALIDNPMD